MRVALISIILCWLDLERVSTRNTVVIVTFLVVLLRHSFHHKHDGNGPIMKTRLSDDLNYPRDHWNCFVYAQVSKQQYFSFQPISSTLSDHNVLICIFNRSLLDL